MKKLTWNELADAYDKVHKNRKARTQLMDTVFVWAESRKDMFIVDKEGCIYLKEGDA